MDKTLQKLYKNLMQEIDEDDISLMLKKEILHLMESSGAYPGQTAYERCRDMAFRAAEAGEEAGFYRGFRYAMQLCMACRQ
ncbi:MAG: hypothetical protein HFH57_06975 [Lachnospiraceae bacterium]|nr:hypothetical protein [Lachnospiraceae bacterium]